MTNKPRRAPWALLLMALVAGIMVYPYAYMVGSSFKTRKEFAEERESLVPPRFQPGQRLAHARGEASALDWPGADWPLWHNYVDAVRYGRVDRYLGNSFIYALVLTGVQLFFNVLAAYAFARMRFAGRDALFTLLLATMMVPPAVVSLPFKLAFFVVADGWSLVAGSLVRSYF